MTLSTITISGNGYVSCASVAEADIYLAVDPVRAATWTVLSTDEKGGFLVAATRKLNALTWAGAKTGGAAQVDAWPRTGVTYSAGTAVSTSEVPQEVEDATCLLAGSIAITPASSDAGTSGSNTKKLKAGSAEIEFYTTVDGVVMQDETAYKLVIQFLESSQGGTSVGNFLSEDTNVESAFSDQTWPGLTAAFP